MASVGVIRHAARDTWQAAAWWLERRYPDEWGRKDRITVQAMVENEAQRLVEEFGMDKAEAQAEVERIIANSR